MENQAMNLKEIIKRSHSQLMQQHEAFFVIQQYIKARKGVDVQPTIDQRMGMFSVTKDIQYMHEMLTYAVEWFRENESEIDKL